MRTVGFIPSKLNSERVPLKNIKRIRRDTTCKLYCQDIEQGCSDRRRYIVCLGTINMRLYPARFKV